MVKCGQHALAFEYQGEMHYYDLVHYGQRETFDCNDPVKAAHTAMQGTTLVEVPFWWDRSLSQLQESIALLRPDLLD